MNKVILIFSAVLFLNCYLPAQNSKLTLEQSIKIGLQNSKELKISESKVESSKERIKEVKSQFLPQLKFNAGYLRQSNVDPYLIIIPFSAEPLQLSEVILNNYTFKLSLQQPIYTGNKLVSSRNSAELMTASSELEFDNEKNNVAANIQIAFWNLYKAIQVKKIADNTLAQTELHITDTKNFLLNGLATTSDLLKLEVQNSNAKLQQLEAANNIELARVSFNRILGLPLDANTDIIQDDVVFDQKKFELNSLTNEALDNRIELKSLNYKLRSASENISTVKSGYYPLISLISNYYYANPNLRIQPPEDVFHGTWDVGVNLSWDVWNWGNTSAQVRQAEQTYVQGKITYDQLKESIELEVNQNYLNTSYLEERIAVSSKAVEQAKDNYKVTKEKYDVQLATSTDLVDAETSVFQTEINYTNAIVDYRISLLKLYRSIGKKLY
ncbi:MAG TPA: TolC family protein [Ignavibacteria bacterium]|mgnify:CR=1 FL=1|nr:TolC family protein [Ignavibacteria bacterium]